MSAVGDKGFWVKCIACGHTWVAAFYPMELAGFAKIMKRSAICPRCGDTKPVCAKQDNGILQEPTP